MIAAAVVLGLLTAWGTRSARSRGARRQSRSGSAGRRQSAAAQGLIVAQVALTFVLVAGAGLLARSLTTRARSIRVPPPTTSC